MRLDDALGVTWQPQEAYPLIDAYLNGFEASCLSNACLMMLCICFSSTPTLNAMNDASNTSFLAESTRNFRMSFASHPLNCLYLCLRSPSLMSDQYWRDERDTSDALNSISSSISLLIESCTILCLVLPLTRSSPSPCRCSSMHLSLRTLRTACTKGMMHPQAGPPSCAH